MTITISHFRKKAAVGMLVVWVLNMLAPSLVFALTSGPAQPESKGFQPAGVSDMVDLESGALKYNIPLLDIDGYPINLNYQSGTGIDDEASWVGLGWSLNPGAITRQVRGLPDDYSGDLVETDHYVKPKVTVGGRLTAKVEYDGIARPSGSFSFGVFNDNYTGLGAELGANAGISFSFVNDGFLTAGLGAGVLSNTQSGVDASFSPYVSLSIKENSDNNLMMHAGLSGTFGYNSRSGMKALSLGTSFGLSNYEGTKSGNAEYSIGGSSINYNIEPIAPTIRVPYTSSYGSFSFDVGGEVFGLFGSVGGTGYQNVRQVKTIANPKPAFGFLYAERGKNNQDAVMDFIRENDNPVIPSLPDLAIPVHTPDSWSYTSQSGSGQFRLFRGGSGAFFDNQAVDGSTISTTGGDLGIGAWVHGGITHYDQNGKTTTRKWTSNNSYLPNGDFQDPDFTNPSAEHVYFRQVGEKNTEDQDMDSQLAGTQALQVDVVGSAAYHRFRNAGNLHGGTIPVNYPIAKTTRRPNRTVISYLTATEAEQAALDKNILTYSFVDSLAIPSLTPSPVVAASYDRVDDVHKAHHISEMMVTEDAGKRMVYGIPVYNISQDEYSFAIDPSTRDANNLVDVPPGITSPTGDPNGIDNYYHCEHKPSYTTGFLLTAILSPDYVDKTGDGITNDDLGTAIKFNYSKLPYYYKWRTPYKKASPNRGLLADPDDDKGSIVYGQKEIWYVQSIESKTKIAYFITQDRRDALGVTGWQYGDQDAANKQKCLREIRLYSKADMTRPIKVVKFQYTYELCPGIPNSADVGGGKLTLSRVWFEYGNSDKGRFHPYTFQYNKTTPTYSTVNYGYSVTDRWGIYKTAAENATGLDNEQYPYTNQTKSMLDANSALWQLNQVTLPTGGVITIAYESGDYAYVQDKKAMSMNPVQNLINVSGGTVSPSNLNLASGISVNIGTSLTPPSGDATAWFKNNFLNGSNYIYTKLYVDMTTSNWTGTNPIHYDLVPTYCLIKSVTVISGIAYIQFTPIITGSITANPMIVSAWQRMKNEYPRYAYPGFDNRVQSANNSVLAAVSAVVNAARNLSELKKSFYQKANSRLYASSVVLSKSFVKLVNTNGFKLGGPPRVTKIQISDTWNATPNYSSYGQSYSYTTTDNGAVISSGVATYEPAVGNDENALKQPIPYVENIKGAINNYYDLELPLGESFYPAPTITYSKVAVNDLDRSGSPSTKTGSVVNEFYTSRDYPVKATVLPIIPNIFKPPGYYSLVRSSSDDETCLSQGFAFEVNDMNGKTKAVTVYDMAGAVISSTVYYYNSQANGSAMSLNNQVNVVDPTTLLESSRVLARDVDFFTDVREQETSNRGQAVNLGGDVFPIPPFIPFFGLPHFPVNENNDYKLFRSVCAVKVIQNYGILSKVVKTENGSSITTENLAYDALTGDALVTRTQNEFKKYIYSVNIPAYWVYKGMGAAYQNLGVLLSGLTTNANGEINSGYTPYLQAGDEIVDMSPGAHLGLHSWVITDQAASGGGTTEKLVDRTGHLNASYAPTGLIKIVKSGFHNMLTASTTTLVSLNSPFTTDNHLQLISSSDLTAMKVINASATTYDESWGMNKLCPNPVVNTSYVFSFRHGDVGEYCDSGATIKPDSLSAPVHNVAAVWQNSLYPRSGIWINQPSSATLNESIGFDQCITITKAKDYFFGFAADNGIQIYIDGAFADSLYRGSTSSFDYWHINPHYLSVGTHTIHVEFVNVTAGASAGLEIYNNTAAQLTSPSVTADSLRIIFSTAGLLNTSFVQSFRTVSGTKVWHYTLNGVEMQVCSPNVQQVVNPYIQGFLGNWRQYQTKVFQQSRNYSYSGNLPKPGVDVKNAGFINNFYSYWYLNTGSAAWTVNPNGSRWITANTVTLYDKYGQQLENRDALGRYSAAKFDFNGELPSAVASNAMNREIYANSFEDSQFTPGAISNPGMCSLPEFTQLSTGYTLKQLAVNTISHSGNYSALLPFDGVTLSTITDTLQQKNNAYLALDGARQYMTLNTAGLYPNGFEPYPSKKYIFDAWVNDAHVTDKSVNLALSLNGNLVPLRCKAVVENWKLVEGTIDLSAISSSLLNISITPNPGNTIYIDDIRIHPFDAQLKTYAYDDKTLRLMAEIDENGFATFYEYDDEGLLIRVKKETEKGVMTLKESRSTYRRKLN